MKRLSAQKKRDVFNLLVEYFNLQELRYALGQGTIIEPDYQELILRINHLQDNIRILASKIGHIIHDEKTLKNFVKTNIRLL